jgi:hypothetical protein
MLVLNRFTVGPLVTAAIAQAQSFTSIEVKPAGSADLQSMRVRVLPNGDLIATSVNTIELIIMAMMLQPTHRSGFPLFPLGSTARDTTSRQKLLSAQSA